MGKIPIEEIKKELQAVELSNEAIEDLLQVLSMKSLTELEGIIGCCNSFSLVVLDMFAVGFIIMQFFFTIC